jgi:hypothetical protein
MVGQAERKDISAKEWQSGEKKEEENDDKDGFP